MTLDANQILALAPDPASAKAGSQLATPRNWSNLGTSDSALWGECQGSGKTPYRTQIDLGGPAFKCTCPSRKFPCKHGLGLYLLRAAELLGRTRAQDPVASLTPREREVLQLMAEGRSNAAIAARMVITEKAVSKHTNSIFTRLGLPPSEDDNRRVLAVLAYLAA